MGKFLSIFPRDYVLIIWEILMLQKFFRLVKREMKNRHTTDFNSQNNVEY